MARKYKRQLGSRNYRNYTEETLQKALEEVRSKQISLRKAQVKYGIHYNTLWTRLKEVHSNVVGRPQALSKEEERCIAAHRITMSSFGFPITTFELRLLVKSYLSRCGRVVMAFHDNLPGKDWASAFLLRHKKYLSQRMARNVSHKRAAINEEVLRDFFDHFRNESEGVIPENMWNYDETNLVDDPGSKVVITRRGAKYPERIRNSSKACTSIMACCNAAGDFAPLYINYKADHIWSTWTENGPPNARYNRTSSGWFDFSTFEDWFSNLMLSILKRQPGKKILIGDNLSSHINIHVLQQCEEHNIAFIALPPNSTHLLQPLDVAVFRPMKEAWRYVLDRWKETAAGSRCVSVPKDTFPSLLKNLLARMDPKLEANVKAGFKKCGLCPLNPQKPMERLPSRILAEASNIPEISGLISATFVHHLEQKRAYVTQPMRKKRKRVNIVPGKSVCSADIQREVSTNAKQSKKPTIKSVKKGNEKIPIDDTFHPSHQPGPSGASSLSNPQPGTSGNVFSKKRCPSRKLGDSDSSSSEFSIPYEESDLEMSFYSDEEHSFPLQSPIPVTPDDKFCQAEQVLSSNVNDNSTITDFSTGDYVVVKYNDDLYPGQITAINTSKITVSSMAKKGAQWIWPSRKDELEYDFEEVLFRIEKPRQISRREIYIVPELKKMLF